MTKTSEALAIKAKIAGPKLTNKTAAINLGNSVFISYSFILKAVPIAIATKIRIKNIFTKVTTAVHPYSIIGLARVKSKPRNSGVVTHIKILSLNTKK